MGTGNKLDPTKFKIVDIYKTEMDPLAKVMRKELRSRGVKHLKVLYSTEKPIDAKTDSEETKGTTKRKVPGSISFVPSVAGLIIAAEVAQDILKNE